MFQLINADGEVVKARLTGEAFTYSSRRLAAVGKRVLEADRKEKLHVVQL